jgi:hypothetical protein
MLFTVSHCLFNVSQMLSQSLSQLFAAVFEGTFCKQIDGAAARFTDPINGAFVIRKTKKFNAICHTLLMGPYEDLFYSLVLSARNAGTCHLNAIHAYLLQ